MSVNYWQRSVGDTTLFSKVTQGYVEVYIWRCQCAILRDHRMAQDNLLEVSFSAFVRHDEMHVDAVKVQGCDTGRRPHVIRRYAMVELVQRAMPPVDVLIIT